MKKCIVLIVSLLSLKALAMNCYSLEDPNKHLNFKSVDGGVLGKQMIYNYNGGRAPEILVTNLFVGKRLSVYEQNYVLYNQEGFKFIFELIVPDEPHQGPCNYRYCDYENSKGKLIGPDGSHELYSCK